MPKLGLHAAACQAIRLRGNFSNSGGHKLRAGQAANGSAGWPGFENNPPKVDCFTSLASLHNSRNEETPPRNRGRFRFLAVALKRSGLTDEL